MSEPTAVALPMTTSSQTQTSGSPSQPPSSQTSQPSVDEAQRTAEARAAFLASLSSAGTHAERTLAPRAADIQANSRALTAQQEQLAKESENLAKLTDEYQKMLDEGREKLKETGDVQNWAEMIERDLLVLEETARIAEEEGDADGRKDDRSQRRWFSWGR